MSGKIKWTAEQEKAIHADGYVLVSAAAGSGKTTVLVERVWQKIYSGADIDKMLIVTFTKAAAAQMRVKIAERLRKEIENEPDNLHLRRQQILLEKALITTIDSFCANIVKENFHLFEGEGISLNYDMLDDIELAVLIRETADELLEEKYNSASDEFITLMDSFTSGKDDNKIYDIFNNIHLYISSVPEPEKWLDEAADCYLAQSVADSKWGEPLLRKLNLVASFCLKNINEALRISRDDSPTAELLYDVLNTEKQLYNALSSALKNGEWDAVSRMVYRKFDRWPGKRNGVNITVKTAAKVYRDRAKSAFEAISKDYALPSDEQFCAINKQLYPLVKQLVQLQKEFEKLLFEKKTQRQKYEFSDIAFLALSILIKDGKRTETAKNYLKRFTDVCVDEYQDTNGLQDAIFKAVSDKNFFLVGDAKQSIYAFRQAMPEIFINRRAKLNAYEDGSRRGYVLLKNNFRSRPEITELVNYIFKNIMHASLGGIEYNEDEYLIPGGEHTPGAGACEMHVLENLSAMNGGEKINDYFYEGLYIADKIKKEVRSGVLIADKNEMRPVKYGDYCILLRASTHFHDYTEAFKHLGVSLSGGKAESLFDAPEIVLLMSLLRAVDNPLRDVDLLAVMYSGVFGFDADELSLIRIKKPKGSLYSAVSLSAGEGDKKCADLLSRLEFYRSLAATLTPGEFIRRLYKETCLPEISCASYGKGAEQNLLKFGEMVLKYEKNGYFGLTGLVRFLDKIKQSGRAPEGAYLPDSDDAVKIMTVHSSKGLEFPVVILAGMCAEFKSEKASMVFDRNYGIAFKAKDLKNNAVFEPVPYYSVVAAANASSRAEELRVLYVALTRAKERLIMVATPYGRDKKLSADGVSAREKKINSLFTSYASFSEISPSEIMRMGSYFDVVMSALVHLPCAAEFGADAAGEIYTEKGNAPELKIYLPAFEIPEISDIEQPRSGSDEALKNEISERFEFKYKYSGIENIPVKLTPSDLSEGQGEAYFAPPAFVSAQNLTSAQAGTATHRFMEKVSDFKNFNFERELNNMLQKQFLTPEQAAVLKRGKIERFFTSSLAKRMSGAAELYREYEISYLEMAGHFMPELPENLKEEKIFVDGIIDALFIENGNVVIVDYKTDRAKSARELTQKYFPQLNLYSRAIKKIWNKPVAECHIYSFSLDEDILVPLK